MRISCLHTYAEDISCFEAAAPAGVTLAHFLRPELQLRFEHPADGLAAEIRAQLLKMAEGADAVLVGSSVLAPYTRAPALSADAVLAAAIARGGAGRRVEVFHCDPMAEAAVANLYGVIPGLAGLTITALPEAWQAVRGGATARLEGVMHQAIDASDADIIALVHPAMAPAAEYDPRALSAVDAALQHLAGSGAGARQSETVG